MTQSRTDSIMEAATNIVIGLAVSFVANMFILPWFLGVTISVAANIGIGVAYTLVSFARSYAVRRLFNGRSVWESVKGHLPRFYRSTIWDGLMENRKGWSAGLIGRGWEFTFKRRWS